MRPPSARAMLLVGMIAIVAGTTVLAQAPPRPSLPPGGSNWLPSAQPEALTTVDLTVLTPADLVSALLGPGVLVQNITYTGVPIAAGTFTGGGGILGFNSGVVLGSGNIASIAGPNVQDGTTTNNAAPGDADLNNLIPGFTTFDATVLEFDFQCTGTSVISFQYVFTSEEYNEYVNSNFNDVFAFFVNGANIAIVPGTVSTPVSINNVNCGNPYAPPGGTNCGQFINNDLQDGGGAIDTEMDGLTLVFTATATINPGYNHIKIAIADAGDQVLDSNVFILGSSFQCALPGPVFEPPTPGLCLNVSTQTANVGVPYGHPLDAIATNGLAGQNVTITSVVATLDGVPTSFPANASHTPALPVTGQPALATFGWTPTAAQVGTWQFAYGLVDQLGNTGSCTIEVEVVAPGCVPTVVFNLGGGCGAPAPRLGMTLPLAGGMLTFDVGSVAPNAPIVLVAAASPFGPAADLVPPCSVQVDVFNPTSIILDQYVTDSLGNWRSSHALAGVPELVGMTFRVQAGILAPGGPLASVMLTDTLEFVVGTCPPCTAAREQWVDPSDPVGQLFQAHWVATFPTCMDVGVPETTGGNAFPNGYHFTGDVAGRDALYSFLANFPPLLPPGMSPPFHPILNDASNPLMSAQGCPGSVTRYAAVLQLNIVFNASGDLGSLPSIPTFGNMVYINPGDPFSGLNVFQIWQQAQLILAGVLPLPAPHTCESFVNLLEELSLSFVDCTPSSWAQIYLFAI